MCKCVKDKRINLAGTLVRVRFGDFLSYDPKHP